MNTIKQKPKFKRALAFSINCLQKAACESGTSNRDNCYYLFRDGGVTSFSLLLEHHPDDEEIVRICGKCLLQVQKLLVYEKVAFGMIAADIPSKAIEVIEFKETTDANKELYIEILTKLCMKGKEF